MRERMAQHRQNAICASCHARLDPLGFVLENFDAIGRWRQTDAGNPIDTGGALPDGTKFDDVSQLRQVFMGRPEQFVEALSEKLLTYAVGRGMDYYDRPALRAIAQEAARDNYRWSSIILGIVRSTPFQMRKALSPTDGSVPSVADSQIRR
jgi:hypothetical protein